jgi:hypothetical protein
MKYVANGFSPNMVNDCIIKFKIISQDEFNKKIADPQVYSIVGHREIADELGVKYNRESISLKAGDILYLVSPKFRPSINEEGVYEHIPQKEGWVYREVTIYPHEEE